MVGAFIMLEIKQNCTNVKRMRKTQDKKSVLGQRKSFIIIFSIEIGANAIQEAVGPYVSCI